MREPDHDADEPLVQGQMDRAEDALEHAELRAEQDRRQ